MVSWHRWSSLAMMALVATVAMGKTEATSIHLRVKTHADDSDRPVDAPAVVVSEHDVLKELEHTSSKKDCEINGVKLRHRSLHYYGEKSYVACSHGQAGCYLIEKIHSKATQVSCPIENFQQKIDKEEARREQEKQEREEQRRLSLAVVDTDRTWTGGVICYQLNADYPFTSDQKTYIAEAMSLVEENTNVRFLPTETCVSKELTNYCNGCVDYVDFKHPDSGRDCNSSIGVTDSGAQIMNLADRCFEVDDDLKTVYGSAMHEIGHSMGLYHEHQHPGRLIGVFWDDIDQSIWSEMKIRDESVGGAYDPDSIMHYPDSYGFCYPTFCSDTVTTNCVSTDVNFCELNDADTTCVDPTKSICDTAKTATIGQRKKLSDGDLEAINELYQSAAWSASNSLISMS